MAIDERGVGLLPAPLVNAATSPYFDHVQGSWQVFSYQAVRALTNHQHFSSVLGGDPYVHPIYASIGTADPPIHTHLQGVFDPYFSPQAVTWLESLISAIVHQQLNILAEMGYADSVEFFATPIPFKVICAILGAPLEDSGLLHRFVEEEISAAATDSFEPAPEMMVYFTDLLAERARHPREDLTSRMLSARPNGRSLGQVELLGHLIFFLAAGTETTANLLTRALLYIDEYQLYDQLRANRSLVPAFLEEVLRWDPPFPALRRSILADTTLAGQRMGKGQVVTGWVSAANRDGSVFAQPEVFEIARRPNPHLSFGAGIHYCIGAHLGRLEGRIALNAVLDRFRSVQRDRSKPVERRLTIVHSVRSSYFAFTPL